MEQALRNRAFTLSRGDIHEEVDSVRVAIADRAVREGGNYPVRRRSAVWKYFPQKTGSHFFVTSSGIQKDMKGTVHPGEAHFGFSKDIGPDNSSWVGPLPSTRHLHVLKIRDLKEGEYQHVFAVSIPGFGLMQTAQAFDKGKVVTWSDPHPYNYEVTYGLTVVEGDWREFTTTTPGRVFIGLLTGDANRHALISFSVYPYQDLKAAIDKMQQNLDRIESRDREVSDQECSVLLWMNREADEPIRIVELNNVRAKRQLMEQK